jgi:phytoene/squalene synthetase
MVQLFHKVSGNCSRLVAEEYSTSFCSAIRLLHKDMRPHIFNIYGFVRFADEIVDSFHDHDKAILLAEFKSDTYEAIERQISLNPILNSFQATVRKYDIDLSLVNSFFQSMEHDLTKSQYDRAEYEDYIYGSAEAVGLMCLYVFTSGDRQLYAQLAEPARALGSAFQKVNFLRDLKDDTHTLSRMYFPGCDPDDFGESDKMKIETDIQNDFIKACKGISCLPIQARFGVYVAYKYYYSLFKKIKQTHSKNILQKRIRIPDYHKLMIVLKAGLKHQLNLI